MPITTTAADPQVVELLKQIAAQTKSTSSMSVALIAGGAALAGALISGAVSFMAALMAARTQRRTLLAQAELEEKRLIGQAALSAAELQQQQKQLEQTGLVERQKLLASLVTTERLRWLQELRRQVAEFYSHIENQLLKASRAVSSDGVPTFLADMDKSIMEASTRCSAICLMLNVNVPEQSELFKALNDSLKFVNTTVNAKEPDGSPLRYDTAPIKQCKQSAFNAMHKIGVKAWDRVKSLE